MIEQCYVDKVGVGIDPFACSANRFYLQGWVGVSGRKMWPRERNDEVLELILMPKFPP